MRLASRSIAANASGAPRTRSARPPRHRHCPGGTRWSRCRRRCVNGAPAEAATSRSPVASITTSAEDGFAPCLGLADHARDLAVPHDGAREPGVQAQVDAAFSATMSLETRFQPSGSNAAANTIGLRLHLRAEIERAPARPFAVHLLALNAVALRRKHGETELRHALDHLHAEAARRRSRGRCVMSSSTSTMPPEARPPRYGVALQHRHLGADARRRERCREPGRAAAATTATIGCARRSWPCRRCPRECGLRSSNALLQMTRCAAASARPAVQSPTMTRKNRPEKLEPTMTVA